MSQDSDGYFGTQEVSSATNEYNAMVFVIRQIMSGKHYCALVKIVAVTSTGTVAKAGTVDVQPMVNQLDGMGNAVPHGVVNGLPYMRLQGGGNAFIMDPVVGDIGLALFADRDISSVKATGAIANPGSLRQSDMADGIYFGGLLNGVPTQYVQFAAAGITISSPNQINLVAPAIQLVGETSVDGSLTTTGNLTVGTGATGSFTTPMGNVVTVRSGIITNIF